MATVVLGDARSAMMKQGKWPGRSQADLADAVKQVMMQKSTSISGTVATLAKSPVNGTRLPCDAVEVKQSIIGDCQCADGVQSPASAKIKNEGALLGDENIFVETLLAAVSIGDEDIVNEVLRGATAPRTENVWATGDNVYVTGMDMSWGNFHIGDLLVWPGAVILNTGYPHWACWKYGVRAGDNPKAYINSAEGCSLRMRGIKGSMLLPSSCSSSASIRTSDPVRIVRKGSPDYQSILKDCRPPLEAGSTLVYRMNGKEMRAAANDTQAYVDLLIEAGSESGRIDFKNYKRSLSDIPMQELGIQAAPKAAPTMEISAAAMSGDGTTTNVGIKVDAKFQCPECRQKFDSEKANQLHWKFIHDPNRHQED